MRDEWFGLLSNGVRRTVLLELYRQRSASPEAVDETSFGDTHGDELSLRHVHLPKLAHAGLVTWDRDAGTVSRGPAFDDLRPLLASVALLVETDAGRSGAVDYSEETDCESIRSGHRRF